MKNREENKKINPRAINTTPVQFSEKERFSTNTFLKKEIAGERRIFTGLLNLTPPTPSNTLSKNREILVRYSNLS